MIRPHGSLADAMVDQTPVTGTPKEIWEFPCSLTQRRFWLMEQLQPGNPALAIAVRWRLLGRIEPVLLEEAYIDLLRRHESLRTGFVTVDGEPMQRVHAAVSGGVQVVDLSHLPEPEREAAATRITLDLARRPFALETPPLARACLLLLGEGEGRFLLTLHHMIADGWSVGILAQELAELYDARLSGRPANLREPELQYADAMFWELERRATTPVEEGVRYWKERLDGLEPFELITDRPRSGRGGGTGHIVSRLLPKPLTAAAAAWAAERGATFFPLALACAGAVLHRRSLQSGIVLGTQVAGRVHPSLEDIVGPFINTIVLRLDTAGDPTFEAFFEAAKSAVEGALAHAETPFEQLIEIVRAARGNNQNPLFQVNLIYQRSFVSDHHRAEFKLLDMPSLSPGAMYDLNLFLVERVEGWRVSAEYATELFDAETVARLLECFERVLAAGIADPGCTIGDLAVAGPAEQAQIARWNETGRQVPGGTIHGLIAERAAATPRAPAVSAGAETLTYAEVERFANRLANLLIRRGVRPGQRVGICLDRRAVLPAVMLAVLKTGAAYVPLDPEHPSLRLRHMAEDAGFTALVTASGLERNLPAAPDILTVLIDRDAAAIEAAPETAPDVPVRSTDIAYILFTSGSTGRPKGVEISHGALMNLLMAVRREPGLYAHDVLVAVASTSFDVAALEMFLPLICGARLFIAGAAEVRDGEALLRLLRRADATFMQATPTLFRMLLETDWAGVPKLRMLSGGEALARELAERLVPCGELWNMYGPTETTIYSAGHRVESDASSPPSPVPIGSPIANTTFQVLDHRQRPVPIGAPGELCIGGAGLARGYIARPELTASRFIRPADPALGERLYRTGDLVRWRNDGTLDYLGRLDTQVKVRGFRIELGEIEAVINADKAVAAAAATTQSSAGSEQLVAFFVPRDGGEPGEAIAERLHQTASETLPAYMRPAAIVPMDALPHGPTGKLDRRQLPKVTFADDAAGGRPLGPVEEKIAELWRGLLGDIPIGPDSDFFALGGDSLAASRFLSRLGRTFGKTIPFSVLFQDATLARVARLVQDAPVGDQDQRVVVLRKGGSRPPIWGISTTTIFKKLAGKLDLDQPFNVVRAQDSELAAILSCPDLETIAAYYLGAVRNVQPHGPYSLLGFCAEGAVAYEMARQLEAQGERVELLVLIDAWAPGYNRRLGPIRGRLADLVYNVVRLGLRLREGLRTGNFRDQPAADLPPPPDPSQGKTPAALIHGHITDAVRRHEPAVTAGRALVIRSSMQPRGPLLDRALGWGELRTGGVEVIEVPGDHLGIFTEPGVDVMAAGLTRYMRARRHD